jgi:hypothetical protein
MKSLVIAIAAATALSAPLVSFAQQSNQPLTRAEVKAQLAQLEKNGYNPSATDPYYPADIQAAEARVAVQQEAATNAGTTTGYGGTAVDSTHAGVPANDRPTNVDGIHPLYYGR